MRKLVLALVIGAVACGSKTPTAPTAPPAPASYMLSGNVTSSGTPVVGATVIVLDGPNANRRATTSAGGAFQLSGLQAGGFTASIAAADYETTTRAVTLIADVTLNIELVRSPRALLENVEDTVPGIVQSDGRYALMPTGINRGDGCAGSISGTTELWSSAGTIAMIAWRLPPTTIVKPGERFT
jgi:Carboxypeptidase regulatory-like domain